MVYIILHCCLNLVEIGFKIFYTFIVTCRAFTPAYKARIIRQIVCWFVPSEDPFADSVIEGLDIMTTLQDLSISDILCGLYLNTFIWHHCHESGYPFDDVHHLRVDEYLTYHYAHQHDQEKGKDGKSGVEEEEEWKEESLESTFEMSDQTREELLFFVKYANAIYGLTL